MKLLKPIFFVFILTCLFTFLVGCPVQDSSQNQDQTQQLQNIYFNYPFRDHSIGKPNSVPLYWECSDQNTNDNYFCSSYNGAFHSGEDWNLKGGSSGEIDEGRPVYSIGEGKVIYAKEEKDESGNNIGFRVVVEHIGTCIIPAKESIEGSGVSYEQEVVGKIYSVYLHLKDVQVKVGDEIKDEKINKPIGYITKAGTGPHLHFEIRKEWNSVYDSYFSSIQQIIDLGFRDPSEFIEANMIENQVIKGSPQTIPEEGISIETETTEGTSDGKDTNDLEHMKKIDRIVYTSGIEAVIPSICFINIDGTNKELFRENAFFSALSPDGKRIAYVQHVYNEGDNSVSERRELRVSSIDGLDDKKVFEVGLTEKGFLSPVFLTWSNDGKGIFFQLGPLWSEIFNGPILFLDLSTRDIKELDIPYFSVAANRSYDIREIDGSIVYIEEILEGIGKQLEYEVYEKYHCQSWLTVSDKDGQNQKTVFGPIERELPIDEYGSEYYFPSYSIIQAPRWSPDGNKIIFLIRGFEVNGYWKENIVASIIDTQDLKFSNFKLLYGTNDYIEDIDWSPSGTKILLYISKNNHEELYIMNENGSGLVKLVDITSS